MATHLTRDDVSKVANLARLKLSQAELDNFTLQLGQILEHFDLLNELDTEDVEPLVHAIQLSDVFRRDEVCESLPRDQALANAPKSDGKFFLVPQILQDA